MGNLLSVMFLAAPLAAVKTAAVLNFSLLKFIFLVGWVYFCVYCLYRSQVSILVPAKWRPWCNLSCLFFGPFVITLFYASDRGKKLERGQLSIAELPADIYKTILGRKGLLSADQRADSLIELCDSEGHSFSEVYGGEGKSDRNPNEIIEFCQELIFDAISDRASDILIDPKSDGVYSIRCRIDGFLRVVRQVEAEKCVAVVNSLKVISGMDIGEKRRPQDGAFMGKLPSGSVFFRVASAGVLGGEKLSIRVINQQAQMLMLHEMGLSGKIYESLTNSVKQSSGMLLICGPTGSGKTTTLYALMNEIDLNSKNVVTVEDPIEYVLDSVSQIEVNPKANITFANSLRSLLRQDPDIICVGEIRDSETAVMAVQAAQTGHLVLGTLHSSSNAESLIRLTDLGVNNLLLAAGLSFIVSQRLVRVLCENCKEPAKLTPEQKQYFSKKRISTSRICKPVGCKKCNGTGYYGRAAIMDVMDIDDKIKDKLCEGSLKLSDLKETKNSKVINKLRMEGLKKVISGITTFEEVKRVVNMGGV